MAAIIVDVSGGVCRIRLNRPDKLNALNEEVRRLLTDAFTNAGDDTDVRVVVLQGAGLCFSASADLTAFGSGRETRSWAERRHASGAWQRLLDLMEAVPQVTVARLHSHCVAGAALIAAACDLRIAADDLATEELVASLLEMPAAPLAMTRAMFGAIGRERMGAAGWADADLLAWALREGEGRQAATDYVAKRLSAREPGAED